MELIREYEVYHKYAPERKVKFRTLRNLTLIEVKEKMVAAGFFEARIIKELRVERIYK